MARTFLLSDLVTRCQQRVDMETSSPFGASEWKPMISTVYAELVSILVASGMRYFESEQSISTSGAATYALPPDYLSTIGVDYQVGAGPERRELTELMAQERNIYSALTGPEARAYAVIGQNVKLYPTPPSGQTYLHVYVPQPADLSAAADNTQVDVVTPDGENFLIWGVAVMAYGKEEADASLAVAERERARARVEEWATLRSLHTPRRRQSHMQDLPGALDDWGDF